MENRELFVATSETIEVVNLKFKLTDLLDELKHFDNDDTVILSVKDGEFVITVDNSDADESDATFDQEEEIEEIA